MRKSIFLFFILLFSAQCAHADVFNDVSRLNPTNVRQIFQPTTVEEIQSEVLEALKLNLNISIAGRRHSQGGQQSCHNCIVLDMLRFNKILSLNIKDRVLRVQSGATWDQIQRYINPFHLSVKVMQTSNIFTVGGSLSANVHGRDARYGHMRNTVRSLRLLLADARIVNVSRDENPDLFRLVIGGLGLFGVILDVDIELTDNDVYEKQSKIMDYKMYPNYFRSSIQTDPDTWLHFAALSIAPGDQFLREMIVTSYRKSQKELKNLALSEETHVLRDRTLLGLSRSYAWGKKLRWQLQKMLAKNSGKEPLTSRNNAMRNPVKFLDYYSSKDTDILQEYFVPIDRFVEFVDGLREIVKKDRINLLHVGIRHVPADNEGYLSYARKDSIALVLYMNQKLSAQGKTEAASWTRRLVDLVLKCDGTYYLVYQLYPTREQLQAAYPSIYELFRQKKIYDPQLRFMNKFYETYALQGERHD